MNWLNNAIESFKFFQEQFNRCSREKNFDGAFESWNTAQNYKNAILSYTNWSITQFYLEIAA